MSLNIVVCDTAEGVGRLQYFFLKHAPELAVEVTTDAFHAVELAARNHPDVVVVELEVADLTTTLEEGTAAKADFLANISHELRTPVTVAKGIAYVLRNPAVADDERIEFSTQLTTSLDKLMMMVDEIITIAELER